MKNYDKDEAIAWLVVRIIIGLVLAAFVYNGFFDKQVCDSNNVNLYCKLTGTIWDWVGCIMFFSGALTLAGVPLLIFKGVEYLYTPPNSNGYALVLYAGILIGPILFWNL